MTAKIAGERIKRAYLRAAMGFFVTMFPVYDTANHVARSLPWKFNGGAICNSAACLVAGGFLMMHSWATMCVDRAILEEAREPSARGRLERLVRSERPNRKFADELARYVDKTFPS